MNEDWIAYYKNDILKYGINANGDWFKSKSNANYNECESNRIATKKEVKTALINEAKKRGFVIGCTWNSNIFTAFTGYSFYYNFKYNNLTLKGATIFKNGIWQIADDIIETITKEEAEKLLNKKNNIMQKKHETIFEMEYRLKKEAKEIAKNHVDVKPIKYLLK
jgi:hypothetical protein